jgi:hypothetical protein
MKRILIPGNAFFAVVKETGGRPTKAERLITQRINHIRLLVLPVHFRLMCLIAGRETPTIASCSLGNGRKTNKGKHSCLCKFRCVKRHRGVYLSPNFIIFNTAFSSQ